MRIYLILLGSMLVYFRAFSAGDTTYVTFDLLHASDHRIRMEVSYPGGKDQQAYLYLPHSAPGSSLQEFNGRLFSEAEFRNASGEVVTAHNRLATANTCAYPGGEGRSSLTAWLHDSWTAEQLGENGLLQTGTHFDSAVHYLLQFHAMLPFRAGFENSPYKITIHKPSDMDVCTAHPIVRRSAGTDELIVKNYYDLIALPVMYTRGFPFYFKSGKTSFRVAVYAQGATITEKEILEAIKPVCDAAQFFTGGLEAKDYWILLHYLDPEKSSVTANTGAIQQGKSSVFCMPYHRSSLKRLRDIQYTLAHELMHLYAPLAMATDLTSKVQLRTSRSSENLWYYEGFTEYLSMLMLYRQKLISEDEFMGEIRNKISLSKTYEPFNMAAESRNIYIPGHERFYSNFYFKGAVAAFLLDLRLMYMSRGMLNLPALLDRVAKKTVDGFVLKDERLTEELIENSYPELRPFFEQFIHGEMPLDFNEFLPVIGWFYEKERKDKVKLYADALYRYDVKTRQYYLLNITYDQVGFEEGDVLLRVNRKKLKEDNFQEVMAQLGDPSNPQQAQFTVKRGKEKLHLTASPVLVNRTRKDFIRIEPRPGPEMAFFRELFKTGRTLEKGFQLIN